MNDLAHTHLKEIVNLLDNFGTDKLHYKSESRNVYSFNE